MDSANEKSVKCPSFDGKPEKYQIWLTRFKAYAAVHGFSPALADGGETDLPNNESDVISESTSDGKKAAAAKKRNAIAMANLTLAFTTESAMNWVYKAMTSAWPTGLAHRVIKAMNDKFKPTDTMSRVLEGS
eukprot:CAMPEP_0197464978 /NCGR_PEP_ID=MMETSP1175-20131217/64306_1 /TAXON_ID=1003142 /ORGANISM="Triceratium dubium, Strain CCMP147" /LENGTH=131 /DNA_ID=CAMNT_0043000981 /DNA_START=172 /DNA_END=567 /DNA_ORIENTATION=+